MDIEINQKQNRSLLEEHAKSSFNFGLLGKNELYVAITFLLIGIVISFLLVTNRLVGLPFIAIGLFEIIKFPTREKRWVLKKEKEKLFNKNIRFKILNDSLEITYDEEFKTHKYIDMKECLISETGILFKISLREYYYISFIIMDNKIKQKELIDFLKEKFKNGRIKIKRTHNKPYISWRVYP